MNTIGITKQEQEDILRIVAAVLHLGNITFGEDDKGNAAVADPSSMPTLLFQSMSITNLLLLK
jgi:myosin-1